MKKTNILLIFFIFLSIPFLIDLRFIQFYKSTISTTNYRVLKKVQVVIVPGASVYKEKPSLILEERLICALELYKKGIVKKIILSGDNGSIYYNEVKPMLLYMLKNNIKPSDIFVDHAGFRTLDTLIRAKKIFQVQEAIFVSQEFHLPRAAYIANQINLNLQTYQANRGKNNKNFYNRFRDFFARTLAWIDLHLVNTRPKYLGIPYPIEGDGRKTWKGSVL